jgi:hypothetical protein
MVVGRVRGDVPRGRSGGQGMARWKALPVGLDPAVVAFVAQLRRLKDEGGLDLRQLAARSGYSVSSWER